jgi:hypothetical protein
MPQSLNSLFRPEVRAGLKAMSVKGGAVGPNGEVAAPAGITLDGGASKGGHLELARTIVLETIDKLQAAGQNIRNARALLAKGDQSTRPRASTRTPPTYTARQTGPPRATEGK